MYTPARSAAAMIISPAYASTSLPSRTIFTVSSGWLPAIRAGAFLDVHHELVAEHPHGRHDRARDRRAERADRRLPGRPRETRGDVVAHVQQEVEVGLATLSLLDASQHLLEPAGALATRGEIG